MIYFAALPEWRIVKVGYTGGNVRERLRAVMREWSLPREPVLLGKMRGNRKVEQKLHRVLWRFRASGEWFFLTDIVQEFIRTCIETGDIEKARAVYPIGGDSVDHRLHEWDSYRERGFA